MNNYYNSILTIHKKNTGELDNNNKVHNEISDF